MRKLNIEEMDLVAGAATGGIQGSNRTKGEWQNNGLGNYDQAAPGNSYANNKAENNSSFPGTGNPPGSGNFPVVPD